MKGTQCGKPETKQRYKRKQEGAMETKCCKLDDNGDTWGTPVTQGATGGDGAIGPTGPSGPKGPTGTEWAKRGHMDLRAQMGHRGTKEPTGPGLPHQIQEATGTSAAAAATGTSATNEAVCTNNQMAPRDQRGQRRKRTQRSQLNARSKRDYTTTPNKTRDTSNGTDECNNRTVQADN